MLATMYRWAVELNFGEDAARSVDYEFAFDAEKLSIRDESLVMQSLSFALNEPLAISRRAMMRRFGFSEPDDNDDRLVLGVRDPELQREMAQATPQFADVSQDFAARRKRAGLPTMVGEFAAVANEDAQLESAEFVDSFTAHIERGKKKRETT
jgi:hypothetical protein